MIGLGGGVTVAWTTCAISGAHCTVTAAHGSLNGGPWRTRTFPAGGQVGDGYVLLSHCAGQVCRLSVSYADRQGRFGNPQTITADGQIVSRDTEAEASSGRRGVRAVVWTTSRGGVFAAVADPGRHRFGPPRRR